MKARAVQSSACQCGSYASQHIPAFKRFSLQPRSAPCEAELFDHRLKGVIVSKFIRSPSPLQIYAACTMHSGISEARLRSGFLASLAASVSRWRWHQENHWYCSRGAIRYTRGRCRVTPNLTKLLESTICLSNIGINSGFFSCSHVKKNQKKKNKRSKQTNKQTYFSYIVGD